MKEEKISLKVAEFTDVSVDGEQKYQGFEFSFHVPTYTVHAGGMYFHAWPEKAKRAAHERARQASRPEVTKSFRICPELEGNSVKKYLATNPQANRLMLAAEILAQRLFIGEIAVPRHPNTENTPLDVLYSHIWDKGIWLKEPVPWFHQSRETTQIVACPQLACRQKEIGKSINITVDQFCSKCGKRQFCYSTPILSENFYSCIDSQCPLYEKPFNIEHKFCPICGRQLGYPWQSTAVKSSL